MEVPQLKITRNSNKFRGPAIHFDKHGYYTFAPKGTSEYIRYWTQEADYCMNGYTAEDGDSIPGYYYFYLNYFPIILVKEVEVETKKGKIDKRSMKTRDFPRFYDYDRWFFEVVAYAEEHGNHMAVLKARRKGYSYKVGAMLTRNFYFYRESKGFATAAESEFLLKDGILTKAWDGFDFLDQNTAWYKKRHKIDTKLHKRASFILKDETGVDTEYGYKSEVMGVTLRNDPDKIRGKSGKLIIFEEAGMFPDLLKAWQVAKPSVEQGSLVFGMLIAFGTGGSEDSDFSSLKELFEKPKAYGCIELKNIWDDDYLNQPCGFFIPQYANMDGVYLNPDDPNDPYNGELFMDEDGNTNVRVAKKFILMQREVVIRNSSDKRAIDRHIAEMPCTPAEACLDISGNIFPKADLQRHMAYVKNNAALSNYKQVGDLYFDNAGKVCWSQSDIYNSRDIVKYRLDPNDDPNGQIVIWEHPRTVAPWGLYVAGCDPYDHDKSGTNSLGSIFVYKRFLVGEEYYELPVAEYTGRPNTANEYYENVRKLLVYYNATLLYENEKKGLFFYFEKMNCTHLLADQPNDLLGDIIKETSVQRKKGVHMNQPIKDWGEGAIRDWLVEEYAPGKKNLTKIMSIPLLEELIGYNDKGNFDRVMAFMMVMLYRQQLHKIVVKDKKKQNRDRLLFPDGLFSSNRHDKFEEMFSHSIRVQPGKLILN